jgi:hypothetical protein
MIRKVGTGFPKKSCLKQKIERDDDSKKSHPAPAARWSTMMSIRYKFFLALVFWWSSPAPWHFPASGESQGQEILPCAFTTDR